MQHLVHIGYPKGASTWLQRHVFSGHVKGITPLLRGEFKPGYRLFDTDDHVGVRSQIEALAPVQGVSVLSNEKWSGLHEGSMDAYARRIHAAVPEAKVLIVLRSQPDMLASFYLHQLVKSQETRGIKGFLREFAPRVDFARTVRLYDELFGENNVTVLLFEDIRTSPAAFVGPMFEALSLPVPPLPSAAENVRDVRPAAVLGTARWINRIGYRPSKAISEMVGRMAGHRWGSGYRHRLAGVIRDEVADSYRKGNRYLCGRLCRELGDATYPV